MMRIGIMAFCILVGTAHGVRAEPYWIAYEGDDFPEIEGWTRVFGDETGPLQGGAERRIEDGALVIDSLRNTQIFDFYEIKRPIDPDAGELFIAEWRVRVLENDGNPFAVDAGFSIAPDGFGILGIKHLPDSVISATEGWSEPVAPMAFHTYRIESSDMENYSFYIDDAFVRNGEWDLFSVNRSFVNFGDGVQGARSLSEWDYVRFGVVPEPRAIVGVALGAALWLTRRES